MNANLGQLLTIGFESVEMSPRLGALLARVQPGGVILFARNIQSADQTFDLLQQCRERVATPIFTAVDMEGGTVDRFRNIFGRAPSAADVFASRKPSQYRKHGRLIGSCCRALGFNTDFAPVVDLAQEASRNVMASRAVSADPRQAVAYAREFMAGLHAAGVIGVGKHFPGLGEADLDTHHELPSVRKPFRKLWEEDIYPYRVMRREFPMILVGHANYARVTRDAKPASLSKKWITDVLRRKIGYRGLIVSDDMEMGGVLKAASIEEATIEFIRAGGDLCLICRQEEFVTRAFEALVREAEKDRKFARRVAESVARILAFKKQSAQLRRTFSSPAPAKVQQLSAQLQAFTAQVQPATSRPIS